MSDGQFTTKPAKHTFRLRPVAGYPGIWATTNGSVWTCWTRSNRPRKSRVWRKLKQFLNPVTGYYYVTIAKSASPDGKQRTKPVHQLVAAAFHGPRPPGLVCRHYNGVRTDNRAENILYGTLLENSDYARRHGTIPRGSKHGIAKLDEAAVLRVKRRLAEGDSPAAIAGDEGVTSATIYAIRRGATWGHVVLPESDSP